MDASEAESDAFFGSVHMELARQALGYLLFGMITVKTRYNDAGNNDILR
jgi:hypothetical protein